MMRRLLMVASSVFPKRVIDYFGTLLMEADMGVPAREYAGAMALVGLVVMLLSFSVSSIFAGGLFSVGITIFSLLLALFFFYLVPLMGADSRAKRVEEVLPDAFMMISSNIRAGMTVENAVLASAKPEFGPLEQEIRRVSTKAFAGTPLQQALEEMANRVRSKPLKRGIKLLIEGNKLGGQMASLLYEVSQDLRMQAALKREIRNATVMYTMFIIFSTLIAAPLLFATSVFYGQISEKISAGVGTNLQDLPPGALQFGNVGKGGIRGGASLTADELRTFSLASIAVTTFFAALTLAQIREGKLLAGLKYVVIFVPVGLAMFFIASFGLRSVFGGIV